MSVPAVKRSRQVFRPPKTWADGVMPLDEFSSDRRVAIEEAIAQSHPPCRYLYFGGSGSGRPLAQIESRAWWEWHWQRGIDPTRRRERLDPWLRQKVIQRDGYTCGICLGAVPPHHLHIDHKYPVALGGTDELTNLQVAHALCNIQKGARV